jgi:hypothetical protein
VVERVGLLAYHDGGGTLRVEVVGVVVMAAAGVGKEGYLN